MYTTHAHVHTHTSTHTHTRTHMHTPPKTYMYMQTCHTAQATYHCLVNDLPALGKMRARFTSVLAG